MVNTNSPSKVTLKDVFSKPATEPATPTEVKAAQHLIRRLIQHDSFNMETVPPMHLEL